MPLERKIHRTQNRIFTVVILLLLGIGTGLISMMLGASYYGLPMFFSYFSVPLLLLLNLLPPVLLMFFAYFVSGRVWIGFFAASLIVLLLSIANFYKIQVRGEPLLVADIILANEAGKVVGGYVLIINWKIWVAATFFIGGTLFSGIFFRYKPRMKTRLIAIAAVLAASILAYCTLFTSTVIYDSTQSNYVTTSCSREESFITRGFLYPYINSFRDIAAKSQIVYNMDEVTEATRLYSDDTIEQSQRVNIISLMLESYADLSALHAIDFNVDVYSPLHQLQQESVNGSLIVNAFAGGTIDTERSFLTGYTALTDFKAPSRSYVRYLVEQGYHAEGVHVGDDWFYDRNIVNPNLGFNNYYFLQNLDNSDRTDEYFFSKVLELFESRDTTVPYFSYNLSYQNHGPYDSASTGTTAFIKQGNLSNASYNILNNYLTGVDDTTKRVAAFIDYFRQLEVPVVVVLFGDHKPWLGNDYCVYNELRVNIDLSSEQGFENFYATPYIVWANDSAKKVLGNDFTGSGGNMSPCFLMNKVFELCSWGGNAYMQAADALRDYTSIVNTATGYFYENSVLTMNLSDEADRIYQNLKKTEYGWQYNFMN